MSQNFDGTLLKILEKEVEKEKWRKKARVKGIVINKKFTKKGSFMLTIKAKKYEYNIVVARHRKKEFEAAESIDIGDFVSIIGENKMSIIFCERIKIINKEFVKQKQMKLII